MIRFDKLPADILSRVPAITAVLLEDHNVVFGYFFGGIAKGSLTSLSDLDIAVYLGSIENVGEYRLDLFDRLSSAAATSEIDLVILNTAPVSLAGRILGHKQVLADKEPFLRHAYESRTLREFFDFRIKEDAFFRQRYGIG